MTDGEEGDPRVKPMTRAQDARDRSAACAAQALVAAVVLTAGLAARCRVAHETSRWLRPAPNRTVFRLTWPSSAIGRQPTASFRTRSSNGSSPPGSPSGCR